MSTSTKRDGSKRYKSECKECRNEKQRARYRQDKEYRERFIASNLVRRRTHRDWYHALKSAPCTDCGVQYPPWVMEHDHVRGDKLGDVAKMVGSIKPKELILAEIAKCDLVCANCHRDRTYRRRLL